MNAHDLRLYSFLARRKRPGTFIGKVLLIAFFGTHLPLLTLLAHFILTHSLSNQAAVRALLVALVATLVGTGATLWALHRLFAPIRLTCGALRGYLSANTLPELPTHYVDEAGLLMADTQQSLLRLDETIRYLSDYDSLTALPNRRLFEHRLGQSIAEARRAGRPLAVLVMDITGQKDLNRRFGRRGGDQFLQAIADQLRTRVRECDTLARIGGDEFALIQTDFASVDAVLTQGRRLVDELIAAPLELDGEVIRTGLNIGIALFPADYSDAEELLRAAEAAMYQAKAAGQNTCAFFSAETDALLQRRLELEKDLEAALSRGELLLHYQPQIDNVDGRIAGVEALLRWRHPVHGVLSPAEFIPIAEASGQIVPIGEWVLRTACVTNASWQRTGLSPVRMAVNLSARQFREPNLVEMVAQVLRETGLQADDLELELTESLAMDDVRETTEILLKLNGMGIRVSLDDFGTGYSSLSQLKRLPIDTLKIDRAFVSDLSENPDNAAITSAVIALAKTLRLEVVAEGVETGAQHSYLRANGCHKSQGFYFSRPIPADKMEALLRSGMGKPGDPAFLAS